MMQKDLPAAAYGKPADGQDEYGILWTQKGFTGAAEQALRRLARAYQFLGGGNRSESRYPDCFALWPVGAGGGWVAARLRDAGKDALDRLHTLRIDAVFLDSEVVRVDQSCLIGLLERDAWPPETFDPNVEFRTPAIVCGLQPQGALAGFDPVASTSSVLRACHNQGTHRFDIVIDEEGVITERGQHAHVNNTHRSVTATSRVKGAQKPSVDNKRRSMGSSKFFGVPATITAILTAFFTGAGVGVLWQKSQSRKEMQIVEAEFSVRESQQADAHARKLSEQQRIAQEAKEAFDSLLTQARQLKDDESSFRALAARYGYSNPFDMETELKSLGMVSRPNATKETNIERIRRLYDSLGAEIFRPDSSLPVSEPPTKPAGRPVADSLPDQRERPANRERYSR